MRLQSCAARSTHENPTPRDKDGNVTGYLKGYNTDGMGYWQGIKEEGIDFKGAKKMVLISTGGATNRYRSTRTGRHCRTAYLQYQR